MRRSILTPGVRHLLLALATISVLAGGSKAQGAFLVPPSFFGADASVITFEVGTTALPVIPGVSFEDSANFGGDSTFFNSSVNSFFGRQYFGNLSSGAAATGYTGLAIDFAAPRLAVGGYLNQLFGDPIGSITTSVYSSSGVLLGQTTTAFPSNSTTLPRPAPVFVGFADPTGIARITFVASSPNFFGVDNVTTAAAAVPEPASASLLAAGFAGVAACFTRRRLRAG